MCGTQKTQIEQSKERRTKLKHHAPRLQTIPQSYSSQNVCWLQSLVGELKSQKPRGKKEKKKCMVLAQKHIHKWKRIDSPEIKPCLCGQLIYNQGAKYIQWRKDSLFKK